jgi:hypothetical protein
VNGNHYEGDATGVAAGADLLVAYNQLDAMIPTFTLTDTALGKGDTIVTGVYFIGAASSLNDTLYVDAKNNANAVFIIQIEGAFSAAAHSKIVLINGALACNIFWKIEGKIALATGTSMKGTMIANNAEITMAVNDTLEGRAFSTTGAITVHGIFAAMPLGCGVPVLTGPVAPSMGAAACFAVFASNGAVSNTGTTKVIGDVGSNGSTAPTGFVASDVTGTIHMVADNFTAQAKTDLALAYTYLDNLSVDILLKYPAAFGNNLVLTPHTYHMSAAPTLIDTVVLNAQGNANAVFVIKINGALNTMVNSKVKLINGAQAKNVYWKIDGAVLLETNSTFCGTTVVNNSSVDALKSGAKIDGSVLTTTGALSTNAINIAGTMIPTNGSCNGTVDVSTLDAANMNVTFYPNPSNGLFTVKGLQSAEQLQIFNAMGQMIFESNNQIETINLGTENGMYFYKVTGNGETLQSGKLISRQ